MSNVTTHGRQTVLVLEQVIDFQDTGAGGTLPAPKFPVGAVLLRGNLLVEAAWAATSTLSIGIVGGSGTKYLNAGNIAAAANVPLTGVPAKEASGATLSFTPNAAAIASGTGKARLMIEYIIESRAVEVQP